ncbi:MAG: sulfotransferase [Halioglobus sp.]|nr:sulfotransferase [Halioglobus sp.]
MSSYLFVLCPPYSGSTLLWKLISTSNNVSALPSEGQSLPELKTLMRGKPWDAAQVLPWPEIKAVWETYWDKGKPVLLEKSPPNLIRVDDILAHFQPVKFVVMVRNPYAHAEGLIRRNDMKLKRAANFSMMCLRTQMANVRKLDDVLVLTYESLVEDPVKACQQLAAFMPHLDDIDPAASFEVHSIDGTLERPITDLNAKKIASLDADTIAAMNEVFVQHEQTFEDWGYTLMVPDSA